MVFMASLFPPRVIGRIDWSRLAAEWSAVIFVTTGAFLVFNKRSSPTLPRNIFMHGNITFTQHRAMRRLPDITAAVLQLLL